RHLPGPLLDGTAPGPGDRTRQPEALVRAAGPARHPEETTEGEPDRSSEREAAQVGQLTLDPHDLEPRPGEHLLEGGRREVREVRRDVELLERRRDRSSGQAVECAADQVEDVPLVWRRERDDAAGRETPSHRGEELYRIAGMLYDVPHRDHIEPRGALGRQLLEIPRAHVDPEVLAC